MKNLKKLKLSNADIMNEQQMKMVTGGYVGEDGLCADKYKRVSCKKQSDCGSNKVCISSSGLQCCF